MLKLQPQSIQSYLKAQRCAAEKGCWRPCVCLRFDRLFALCFYGGLEKGWRAELDGPLFPGCIMCLKEAVLAGRCDLEPGWRPQVCAGCRPDWVPGWGSPSSPCRNAAPCLGAAPAPAPSAPPAAPPPLAPGTSAPVPASPEPGCCGCTHPALVGYSRWSHSEDRT